MTAAIVLTIPLFGHEIRTGYDRPRIVADNNTEALTAILEGMRELRHSRELAEALSEHSELCELAAQVAAIVKIRKKIADDIPISCYEWDLLRNLHMSKNPWIAAEARIGIKELEADA